MEPIDPKEIQALRDQMAFLEQKIRILEDSEKPDVSAEKAQLRYLFQQFSPSGTSLNASEFQKFLTVLAGQPFSEQEVQDLLQEINRAGGGSTESVTFPPFYALWSRQGAVFSVAEQKLNNTKQLLMSGLARRSFSRAIQRFFARNKRPLNPLNTETAEVHFRARTAEFSDSKCAIALRYFEDPVMAAERRMALKLPSTEDAESAMIFSVAFGLKAGVDEFALGEIAGSIKDLLALAKEELGSTFHNVQLATEEGVRVFRISISFSGENEMLDLIKSTLNEAKVESLFARVDFSHPLSFQADPQTSTERLAARVQLDAKASTTYVDLIHQALNAEAEKQTKSRMRRRAVQKKDPFMASLSFLRALQNVTVEVNMDAFARAFLQSFEDEEIIGTLPYGWNAVRRILAKNLLPAFSDPSIPPLVFDTIFNTVSNLGDLLSVTVQFGDNVYRLSCENLPVLTLFPLKKQLQELQNEILVAKAQAAEKAKKVNRPLKNPPVASRMKAAPPHVAKKPAAVVAKPAPPSKSQKHHYSSDEDSASD